MFQSIRGRSLVRQVDELLQQSIMNTMKPQCPGFKARTWSFCIFLSRSVPRVSEKEGPAEAVTLSLERWRSSPPAYPHHYLIALWTRVLVAYSVTAGSNKSMQSGPRSCICMIVCIGLGLSRYKQLDGQDDQINCLRILSIFVKQRTYLTILSILTKQKDLFEHLPNRFEKHLPEGPKRPAELQTPSCGLCLREGNDHSFPGSGISLPVKWCFAFRDTTKLSCRSAPGFPATQHRTRPRMRPSVKERRMMFANTTNFNRESGGA